MSTPSRLQRVLGLPGSTIVGVSAMLGTGVFAVWTPAWQLAGPWLLVALLAAAAVAALNATSTARLARVHPESGGAYAYGRIRVHRVAGLVAGYGFVIGKSASAAAAALTIGAYVWPQHDRVIAWLALLLALAIDLRGVTRSVRVSGVLVAIVTSILIVTIGLGLTAPPSGASSSTPGSGVLACAAAAGLLFVAFAGYARLAVLGEEVRAPERTIPRAMLASFVIVSLVYFGVGVTILRFGESGGVFTAAPLADVVLASGAPRFIDIVSVGAVLGAGAVLISLIAGIGRTVFAMASRGDAPPSLAAISARRIPYRGSITAAVLAAVLILPGRLSWALALSAGTVLGYYVVAHLAAWSLGRRIVPALGILGCGALIGALALVAATGGLPGR